MYSFHCSYCRHTVFAKTKEEVRLARVEHRNRRDKYTLEKLGCILYSLPDGTLARPSLVKFLQDERLREENIPPGPSA